MQSHDPDAVMRSLHVQSLCREVRDLVALSREQRRSIDGLLSRLEAVMRVARLNRTGRGSWRTAASSQG
jgi:hypothetical protein